MVDKDFVTSLGLKGEVALKLRYAWERNSVTNWNNDTMQPYMYTALHDPEPQAAYVHGWPATIRTTTSICSVVPSALPGNPRHPGKMA